MANRFLPYLIVYKETLPLPKEPLTSKEVIAKFNEILKTFYLPVIIEHMNNESILFTRFQRDLNIEKWHKLERRLKKWLSI